MGVLELLAGLWLAGTVLCLGFFAWRAHRKTAAISAAPGIAEQSPGLPLASRTLELEREVAAAIAAVRGSVADRLELVELQHVIQPRLVVWADPFVLRRVLVAVLSQAIGRAEGGGVLLCGMWHGGRVHITVTDDGTAEDPKLIASALRDVERAIALQGGTLEVTCAPTRGTVVTLRLPGLGEPKSEPTDDLSLEEPRVRGAHAHGFVATA